jgi:hypothetical protein
MGNPSPRWFPPPSLSSSSDSARPARKRAWPELPEAGRARRKWFARSAASRDRGSGRRPDSTEREAHLFGWRLKPPGTWHDASNPIPTSSPAAPKQDFFAAESVRKGPPYSKYPQTSMMRCVEPPPAMTGETERMPEKGTLTIALLARVWPARKFRTLVGGWKDCAA